jgi:hypothetical protein
MSAEEKEKGNGAVINIENGIWQALGGIRNVASFSWLKLGYHFVEIFPSENPTDSPIIKHF